MTTVTDALLPCPFCRSQSLHVSDGVSFYVECRDCHAEGPWNDDDLGQAITAWNTRADRQAAILESMEIMREAAARVAKGRRAMWSCAGGFGGHSSAARIIGDEVDSLDPAAILAAHTRAKAMDELIAGDADLL